MTVRTRNYLFWFMYISSIVLLVAQVAGFFFIDFNSNNLRQALGQAKFHLFGAVFDLPSNSVLIMSLHSTIAIVGSVFALTVLNILFKRVVSSELFFIAAFVWSLSAQISIQVALFILSKDLSDTTLLVFSKIYFMFGLFGLITIFVSSLHLAGLAPQYDTLLFSLSILAAFFIGTFVPFDGIQLKHYLLLGPVSTPGIQWLFFGLNIMTILNILKYVLYPKYNNKLSLVFSYLAILLAIIGFEFEYHVLVLAIAWALMIVGLYFTSQQMIRKQIWY